MKKQLLTLPLLLGLTTQAFAGEAVNTFQHEANVNFGTDTDHFEDGVWNLDYRFYFKPVENNNAPQALAGFLAQSSYLGGMYAQANAYDDTVRYTVDGRYVMDSNWFIGANYLYLDVDQEDFIAVPRDEDQTGYGINFGYYFNDSSEVAIYYQYQGNSDSWSLITEEVVDFDLDNNLYGAHIRTYFPLQSTTGLDLKAQIEYGKLESSSVIASRSIESRYKNDTTQVSLSADWYITPAWSVGAGYSWFNSDAKSQLPTTENTVSTYSYDDSINLFSLSTKYWWQISNSFAANFAGIKRFSDEDTADDFLIGIGVNARF
ncbi:MtrB/PioB family outer membrane beta-barrel protein [Shewanella sp. JBTF-M18]|uniref:MtrB/PioB family outer membrane beta-barrel protein n=1 Tax=Shewanella insulae TaxID=2681496 RepID=A0A6L7HZ37_9GAMM|nr:MtrB/PioB family outer membrane beta-barrel protein [Shewanella insulae]MXR69516.1 MtrB/PioB family outer membrane beta-barrel protein [Shewanella insulae]